MTTTLTHDDIDRFLGPGRPNPRRRRRFQRSLAGLAAAGALFALGTATMSSADYSERYVTDHQGHCEGRVAGGIRTPRLSQNRT